MLADFALSSLQARRITLRRDARNDASPRVAQRAGFLPEGRLRDVSIAPEGPISEDLVYALEQEDQEQSQVR